MSRFSLRSLTAVAVATAALLTAAPSADALAAETDTQTETEQAEAETREVVDLQLKIAARGQAVGQIAQLVELDTDTSLALEADGHQHAIAIKVHKADEQGRKLSVTLGYLRDGQPVLETITVEAAAKKAKVVRSKEGQVALSLKLAPKMVSADELPKPEAPRKRVEIIEDTNDPLAGLE